MRDAGLMRGITFWGLVTICLALWPAIVCAQVGPEPVVTEWTVAEAPAGGWTVGDRIPLRLSATYPAGVEVVLPELPAQWESFEVLEQRLLAPVEKEQGRLTAVREATVTLWGPGDYQMPSFAVRYREADDQLYEYTVPPLTITVVSVLSAGDTQKKDLKPQVSLTGPPLWPWIVGALSLAVLMGVVGWLLLTRLRRRARPALAPGMPLDTRSPEEIAHQELDRITALDLPVLGELKRHYTLVADCIRTYVEGRYHIPALDRTTSELATAMRRSRVDRGQVALLRDLLAEADLVKFAKLRPPTEQARNAVAQARHIVDTTGRRISETWASSVERIEQDTQHESRNP